jgi:hypothetical protein
MAFYVISFSPHFFYGIVGKRYHHIFPSISKPKGDFISIMLYRFSLSSSCFNAFCPHQVATSVSFSVTSFGTLNDIFYVIVASRMGVYDFQYFDSNPPPSDARLGISYLQLARYRRFYFDDPIKEARILLSPSPVYPQEEINKKYRAL